MEYDYGLKVCIAMYCVVLVVVVIVAFVLLASKRYFFAIFES